MNKISDIPDGSEASPVQYSVCTSLEIKIKKDGWSREIRPRLPEFALLCSRLQHCVSILSVAVTTDTSSNLGPTRLSYHGDVARKRDIFATSDTLILHNIRLPLAGESCGGKQCV